MIGRRPRTAARWIERTLAGVAIVCLGWVGVVTVRGALFDHQQRGRLDEQRAERDRRPYSANAVPAPPVEPGIRDNDVIGLLEIPRLNFSEILIQGDSEDTLRIAIGHLPDTPLPWQPGNSAFAGHRDGRFRPLKDITIGDRIRLATPKGDLDYVLRETFIVKPEDVWVLKPTPTRTLTLITCYPFVYIGKAPQRFVMKADALPGAGEGVAVAVNLAGNRRLHESFNRTERR